VGFYIKWWCQLEMQKLPHHGTYLVELFLQGSDDLSMDDSIVIFQCIYEFIENSNRFL
jgi:hypothetical protein